MKKLLVIDKSYDWLLPLEGVEVVEANDYLLKPKYSSERYARVINLCEDYSYQSLGYYVTLLAMARNHRITPKLLSLVDLKSISLQKIVSEDLEEVIEKSLSGILADRFELSIYFGKNLAKKYDRLCLRFNQLIEAPLFRVEFLRGKSKAWKIHKIRTISLRDVPESHRSFLFESMVDYFSKNIRSQKSEKKMAYQLAILTDSEESHAPSDEKALARFERAAFAAGIEPTRIEKSDFSRLSEFDALFIRVTTQVNHYSYRFARRAEQEGLVVIDDPTSILRCTNKIFLQEGLRKRKIGTPRAMIVGSNNLEEAIQAFRFPLILKLPDSSFSQGVYKVNSKEELSDRCESLFQKSDLLLVQEFLPSAYDWRIGVLENKAFYACKYHMAVSHWQIISVSESGRERSGRVECVPLDQVPQNVIEAAESSSELIGEGLYGIDLKEVNSEVFVIEINDNPSIDAGYEDQILKHGLYDHIMSFFRSRLDRMRQKDFYDPKAI